jgi:hypothetical protein
MGYVENVDTETSLKRSFSQNFAPPDCDWQGRREAFPRLLRPESDRMAGY